MAESDSETEEANDPVSEDWVANEIIDHADKIDSEDGVMGPTNVCVNHTVSIGEV